MAATSILLAGFFFFFTRSWQLPRVRGRSHSSVCHSPSRLRRVVTLPHRSGDSGERAVDVFFLPADRRQEL